MALDWTGVGVENCSFTIACCSLGSSLKVLNAVSPYSASVVETATGIGTSSASSLRFMTVFPSCVEICSLQVHRLYHCQEILSLSSRPHRTNLRSNQSSSPPCPVAWTTWEGPGAPPSLSISHTKKHQVIFVAAIAKLCSVVLRTLYGAGCIIQLIE